MCDTMMQLERVDGLLQLQTEFASMMDSTGLGIVFASKFEQSVTVLNDLGNLVRFRLRMLPS